MPERRETPQWITEAVTLLGGLNKFSKPNFRVIWGSNRTHKVGGFFKSIVAGKVFEVPEVRELLKYHPERWHLERWRPAEIYGSQEDWYRNTWDELAQVHTCGDYPAEGDYEHVFYLAECPHIMEEPAFLAANPLPHRGQFLDFGSYSEAIENWRLARNRVGIGEWCNPCKVSSGQYIGLEENFRLIELQIQAFTLSDFVTEKEEREALFAREHAKRMEESNRAEAIVRNRMMAFGTIPHTYVADPNRRCSVPDAKFNPAVRPLGRSPFRMSNRTLPNKKQGELV
jgi:hypothetical protein